MHTLSHAKEHLPLQATKRVTHQRAGEGSRSASTCTRMVPDPRGESQLHYLLLQRAPPQPGPLLSHPGGAGAWSFRLASTARGSEESRLWGTGGHPDLYPGLVPAAGWPHCHPVTQRELQAGKIRTVVLQRGFLIKIKPLQMHQMGEQQD